MKKNPFVLLAVAGLLVVPSVQAQFASSVIGYNTGVGYDTRYVNPVTSLGEPTRINPFFDAVEPMNGPYGTNDMVSIGAGGFLTLQFSAPIQNNPGNAFGLDFIIFGHQAFTITNDNFTGGGITDGSFYTSASGNSRVSVSEDGVNFFQLDPLFAPNVDRLYPTDGSGDFQKAVDPSLTSSSFAGLDTVGIRALYNGSGGGMGYDISWALGTPGLSEINYVRIEGVDGNRFIDGVSATVPEPSTWALLAIGAFAVGLFTRRNAS